MAQNEKYTRMMKLYAAVMAAVMLLASVSAALAEKTAAAFQPIYPLREDAPELTPYGLLPENAEMDYYLVMDREAGEWTYIDHELFINIRKFNEVVERKRDLIWYETEIKVAPGIRFETEHANTEELGRRFM